MDLGAILTEVSQALTATGVSVYASVPDAADYPALVMNPPSQITYGKTLAGGGGPQIDVPVTIYVQASDMASAWQLLYQLLSTNVQGATSIADALHNHTPTNYRQLTLTTANAFRPQGEAGIAVDANLTIYS